MSAPDDERQVDLSDEDLEVLPDTPVDERDILRREGVTTGDDIARLLEDRPPHWD